MVELWKFCDGNMEFCGGILKVLWWNRGFVVELWRFCGGIMEVL